MINLQFTLTGLEDVLADIDRRIEALKANVHADLDWFGRTATAEMVATHTFQNRTYRLESSIQYKAFFWTPSRGWRVEVEAGAWYASQVEFGHAGPPPARPYPFFWPVFYRWWPDALLERLQGTVERSLSGEGG
jgi:hypothetical protein